MPLPAHAGMHACMHDEIDAAAATWQTASIKKEAPSNPHHPP